jgi:hypothetical protein
MIVEGKPFVVENKFGGILYVDEHNKLHTEVLQKNLVTISNVIVAPVELRYKLYTTLPMLSIIKGHGTPIRGKLVEIKQQTPFNPDEPEEGLSWINVVERINGKPVWARVELVLNQ